MPMNCMGICTGISEFSVGRMVRGSSSSKMVIEMYCASASIRSCHIPRLLMSSPSHSTMSSGMPRTVLMMSSTPPRTALTRSWAQLGRPEISESIAPLMSVLKRSPAVSAMSRTSSRIGRSG